MKVLKTKRFKTAEPKVDAGVVELLRELLGQAERGELLALAGVGLRTKGEWSRFTSPEALRDPARTLGYLRVLEMVLEQRFEIGEPEEFSG